jgi:uncharacterized protein
MRRSMPVATLPEILETKETLDGTRKTFRCRVIDQAADQVVVLFVSDRLMGVPGLQLPIGTVTFGYFWLERPYNVYHWMTPAGLTLAHYFNLADRTSLGPGALSFRDLAVDLLVTPDGAIAVLDEDEVPATLDPITRTYLDRAKVRALADAPDLVPALEKRSRALWPRVFPEQRP